MVSSLIGVELEAFSITDVVGRVTQYLQTVVSSQNKMFRLRLANSGLIESYVELDDSVAVDLQLNKAEYQHVSLIKDDAGLISIQPLPYRATPYPSKPTAADVYQHPNGKSWAIIEQNGQIVTYFCNAQTNWLWVCQEVDKSKSLEVRIKEKESNDYKYNGTFPFNPLTRTFEI